MPIDYKALEQQIIADQMKRQAALEVTQAKARVDAVAALEERARPLTEFMLPELEALRSQMAGKYTVEVSDESIRSEPGLNTTPSITFEVVNDVSAVRSGRITVRIIHLSGTAGHGPADGVRVTLFAKGSRDGRDREEDLAPTLGIQPRASLDQQLAQHIVKHAFERVIVGRSP